VSEEEVVVDRVCRIDGDLSVVISTVLCFMAL
jgi:hypothetical protein